MSTSADGFVSPIVDALAAQVPLSPLAEVSSALGKIWRFPTSLNELLPAQLKAYEALRAVCAGSHLAASILWRRGIVDVETALAFLDSTHYVPSLPTALPDVDKACVRINQAIADKQHITVYGDYDVDGVTGTSVLYTVLRKLGASVDFYIPNRASEGYGLNLKAVSVLASKHRTKLLITCDCGVSNFAEINFAKSLGVDTLVLDHHSMPEMLPPAVAIVHPKRLPANHPLFDLPGVGVAYKVCEALLINRGMPEEVEHLLDFVTLGMIADLVPLIRENRYLVQIGLPRLINSPRPGIQALLGQVQKSQDTDIVGFGLAPRINAVGRLADARAAVELMTTDDAQTADNLAKQLQLENAKRQELCEQIFAEADQMVQKKIDLNKDKAIAIYSEGWHHGVVGIVASRLVERYHRPVFIGELDIADNSIRGSARGVDGMDLYEALKANEHLLSRWGGHKMAAGFSLEVEQGPAFVAAIVQTCNRLLAKDPLKSTIDIDMTVEAESINHSLVRDMTQLAPFGMANKKPLIYATRLNCQSTRTLGKEGKHHRLMLEAVGSEVLLEAVFWNSRGRIPKDNEQIDIVFTPEINSYNGRDRLQLILADWRSQEAASFAAQSLAQHKVLDKTPTLSFASSTVASSTVASSTNDGNIVMVNGSDTASGAVDFTPPPQGSGEVVLPKEEPAKAMSASKIIWKDLRGHLQPDEILIRAAQKFAADACIFGETIKRLPGVNFCDRTGVSQVAHLVFAQFPPSQKVFQEIVSLANPSHIYLLGVAEEKVEIDETAAYLKRLIGLVKFAINQKEGQVEGEKLAALMGATKMSLALGLTVLRKVHLIDWFAEDGNIFLDWLGEAQGSVEELPEFKQLAASLNAAREFRSWCQKNSLKDIQLGLMLNESASGANSNSALTAGNGSVVEQVDFK